MDLVVSGLRAGYGAVTVLRDISLEVTAGRIVTLVGPNGAGKSTLLRCLSGLHRPWKGSVRLDGAEVAGLPAHRVARMGLALVPEGRQLFSDLTVEENLRMGLHGCVPRGQHEEIARRLGQVYDLFPVLREFARRRAGALSGGQQQMLAIGRALVREPKVLMLDEPSLGLAPKLVSEIFDRLEDLRAIGTAVLLVEQNAAAALRVADQGCVMDTGQLSPPRPAAELLADEHVGRAYLGAGASAIDRAPASNVPDLMGRPLFP